MYIEECFEDIQDQCTLYHSAHDHKKKKRKRLKGGEMNDREIACNNVQN